MAIGIYAKGFTTDDYDKTLAQLEQAGALAPAGRVLHVALESNGEISVFDIWESQAAFDAYGATLIPILIAAGIEAPETMVAEVYNTING
jgi:hypothetical protein